MKKKPRGKIKPLAIDVFAEQAKVKTDAKARDLKESADRAETQQERINDQYKKDHQKAEMKVENLVKEIVDAKKTNNQNHLGFAGAVIAGAVGTNFILLQAGTPIDVTLKYTLLLGSAMIINRINKHFGKRGAVFKKMLREANKTATEFSKGNINIQDIQSFHKLHDIVKDDVLGTKEKRRKVAKEFNNRSANWAVGLVMAVCIISLADKGYNLYREADLESRDNENTIGVSDPDKKRQKYKNLQPL